MGARDNASPAPIGLPAALRALGATLGETVGIRGNLFAIELREEIERRKAMLLLAALAAVFIHMALLLATALVVIAFWETHPAGAVATLAALYLAGGLAALAALRRWIAASPEPFASTRDEFSRDLEQLRAST